MQPKAFILSVILWNEKNEEENKNFEDSPAFSFTGMVEAHWKREEKKDLLR